MRCRFGGTFGVVAARRGGIRPHNRVPRTGIRGLMGSHCAHCSTTSPRDYLDDPATTPARLHQRAIYGARICNALFRLYISPVKMKRPRRTAFYDARSLARSDCRNCLPVAINPRSIIPPVRDIPVATRGDVAFDARGVDRAFTRVKPRVACELSPAYNFPDVIANSHSFIVIEGSSVLHFPRRGIVKPRRKRRRRRRRRG